MKNLELWHEHSEEGAASNGGEQAQDAAVSMAHVTLDASAIGRQNNTSNDEDNDYFHSDEHCPAVVTLYQSGRLTCQRQQPTSSSPSSLLLWQVDLNKAVLEQDNDDDDDDEDNNQPPVPETDWFQVQVIAGGGGGEDIDDPDNVNHDSQNNSLQLCCLGRAQGVIVTLSLQGTNLELVGAFEQGILAAAWSHAGASGGTAGASSSLEQQVDSILALVVTQDDEEDDDDDGNHENNNDDIPKQQHVMLLTMTQDFQVLQEVVLETISPTQQEQSKLFCPKNVSLCWRPDGKWLAALLPSLQQQQQQQAMMVTRIFEPLALSTGQPNLGRTEDGSGKLLPHLGYMVTPPSSTEQQQQGPHVRNALAWANESCSLLLACSQHVVTVKKTTTKIVLMEPNGLQHGGFSLPKTTTTASKTDKQQKVHSVLVQMAWALPQDNCNMLALHVRQYQSSNDGETQILKEQVQVWHRSNYHWYLKQEFIHDAQVAAATVTQMQWDTPAFAPRQVLTVLLSNGRRWYYQMGWNETVVPSQTNTALVVDGTALKCTPLGRALTPPPMSAAKVDLTHVVRHVALVPPSVSLQQRVVALVQLSNQSLVVLGKPPPSKTNRGSYRAPVVLLQMEPPSALGFHNFIVTGVASDGSQSLRIDFLAVETTESILQSQHLLELSMTLAASSEDPSQFTTSELECTGKIPILNHDDDQDNRVGHVLTMSHWQSPQSTTSPTVTTTQPSEKPGRALVELDDGQLYQYISSGGPGDDRTKTVGTLQPFSSGGMMDSLLEPCPWIVGVERSLQAQHDGDDEASGVAGETEQVVIGMSWQKRLYCGDVLLADSITSFHVSDRFLCYATTATTTTATTSVAAKGIATGASQLKFIALSQLFSLDPFMGASDENNAVVAAEYEPRNVERGSRIVSVLRNKPMVILQLPRGNLEGVAPRALVLPHVLQQVISHRNYKAALEMMRQQKVDLNLLVDWNPDDFLSRGAEELLQQVTNVDHLNLFISSLRNENVTQTRHFLADWFREEFGLPSAASSFDFTTKVNQVCRKLRSIISDKARVGQALLLPVLSTFAKEDPPQLEAALSLIQKKAMEENEESGNRNNKKPPLFSERAQSSIQYLAFLANYNLLFDTALGMYELDLARAVARNSQMDPKMYLPLLKQYRELPEFYMRYEIDMRLKRYPEALRNLVKSIQAQEEMKSDATSENISTPGKVDNSFRDALQLIKTQKLHRLGLELFHEEGQQREILLDLGDYLLKSGAAENALTIFMTLPDPTPSEQILIAAKKCQDWRTYLSFLLSTSNNNNDDGTFPSPLNSVEAKARDVVQEMTSSVMAAELFSKRKVLGDAARIMLDYCNDPSEAVDLLIQGELWSEGQRVAMLNSDHSLSQKCVDAAKAHAHSTMETLPDRATTFASNMERYEVVLQIRKEAYARGESELPSASPMNDDAGSLFSAASQASHLTGASATSASSTSTSASYSTVISVSSNTSSAFSITGSDQTYRHKSKYNQIGQKVHKNQKRKKKKGKSKPNRVIPGSEKELETLTETLRMLCLDVAFMTSISECIVFLARSGQLALAADLYKTYQSSIQKMQECQENRLTKSREAREHQEQVNRREGIRLDPSEELLLYFVHPLESKVDALVFEVLPSSVHSLFEYLPQEMIVEDGY